MRGKTNPFSPPGTAILRRRRERPKGAWIFFAGVLTIAAARTSPGSAQPSDNCPAPDKAAQIEVLPATPFTGNTCGFTNTITRYGPNCPINGLDYSKEDAIYKVWLHAGNSVEFKLTMTAPANLALALIKPCDENPSSCKKSSRDPFGSADETISRTSYDPGVYFLVIDANSRNGACGAYQLTVTGVNPVPDLVTTLTAAPDPVRINSTLTYTLSVVNSGALDATGVKLTLTRLRPADSTVTDRGGCTTPTAPDKVVCDIGNLPVRARAERKIKVTVSSAALSPLTSTASADADEGDQNPANDGITLRTRVVRSFLSIEIGASRDVAVIGESLTYTLRVSNDGPSAATGVVLTDILPPSVSLVSAPDCEAAQGTVTCTIPTLSAGASAERSITVMVQPSAADEGSLANTASVSAAEIEADFAPESATVTIPVTPRT